MEAMGLLKLCDNIKEGPKRMGTNETEWFPDSDVIYLY